MWCWILTHMSCMRHMFRLIVQSAVNRCTFASIDKLEAFLNLGRVNVQFLPQAGLMTTSKPIFVFLLNCSAVRLLFLQHWLSKKIKVHPKASVHLFIHLFFPSAGMRINVTIDDSLTSQAFQLTLEVSNEFQELLRNASALSSHVCVGHASKVGCMNHTVGSLLQLWPHTVRLRSSLGASTPVRLIKLCFT